MLAKFEFGVFLSCDAMLVQYMSLCVHMCDVDVSYQWLSDWTCLQWALRR